MNNASYFVHLVSWYHHRDKDDVLIIFFEDLKDDVKNQVLRVAKFISTEKVRTRESFATNERHANVYDSDRP
jgi:hypothetical protein